MAIVLFIFESQAASPNLATWPAGDVPVTIYARVQNPGSETCYIFPRLFRGQEPQHDVVPYDMGDAYEPAVAKQALTTSWALYTFNVAVRTLDGPTSDRLMFYVMGQCVNSGPEFKIGSDGGSNHTKVETLFFSQPAVPTALERSPDGARPGEVITTSIAYVPGSSVTQPIATFDSHVGDPGMVVWPARTWRFRIWARVTSGTATITADLGRKAAGGIVTSLAANVAVATVTSSTWTLFRKDVAVAETVGATLGTLFDVIRTTLNATSSNGAVLLVAVGLDHPSSINAPLLSPSGGTVIAPADDGKVMTESDSPRWYLRDAVQSSDGSIVLTVNPASLRLNLVFGGSGYVRPNCFTSTGDSWLWPTLAQYGRSDHIDWHATSDFLGISKTWSDGVPIADRKEIRVYIANATPASTVIVRDGATPPAGSSFLPLALPAVAGAPKDMEFDSPTELCFWLNMAENRWCLRSYQSYTVPSIGGGGAGGSFAGAIDGGATGDATTTIDGGHS